MAQQCVQGGYINFPDFSRYLGLLRSEYRSLNKHKYKSITTLCVWWQHYHISVCT